MPIYTKTGDDGTTGLYGGKRVLKSNTQVEAYGAVDEATSSLGPILAQSIEKNDREVLTAIQKNLYGVMAFLCGAPTTSIDRLNEATIELEKIIDAKEKKLVPLKRFILPQGTSTSSFCHVARSTVRRSERRLVECIGASQLDTKGLEEVLAYINRLSDYLFVLGRWYNRKNGDILT